ncbi:MAG: hypothetical protein JOZ78_10340 [Chroococcidiopsidaceae cyanobacterium CP_BM_ER_R8_30]|nr:hypothetical protein [Chroococcidiopsidaceae cyanobacterium CP_BM_ER_R8_30]
MIKREFRDLLPVWIYFFITFNALAFTKAMMLKDYGIQVSTFASAAIGSLVAAKVVLIADFLPFLEPFPKIPIIYNVIWKTLIYWLVGVVVQVIEHIMFHGGFASTVEMLDQPHFWLIQFWLVLLLFLWCNVQELLRVIGLEEVKRIYLGIRSP